MAKKEAKANKKEVSKNKKSFSKDFKAELKKVIWPTPKQLVNNTVAVVTIVLITAAIVFVLDLAFESVNKYGVNKIKEAVSTMQESSNEENNTESTETNNDENAVVEEETNTEVTPEEQPTENTATESENTVAE